MRSPLRPLLGGLLFLAMSRPLGAQRSVVIDAGIAGAYFPADDASAGGPYLRLSTSASSRHLFGSLDAGAIAAPGAAAGFGTVRGGWRSSQQAGWSSLFDGELSTVAGSSHSGAAGTGIVTARAMWAVQRGGAWLRGSTHSSSRTNSTLAGYGIDATAWYSLPQSQLSVSIQHERTRAELYTGRFRTGFVGTAPVRYTEGSAALHVEGNRASADLTAALRRDADATPVWDHAVGATSSLWMGERVAFVLAAACQLPDWVRGADAANTFSIGLRFRQAAPERVRAGHVLAVVSVSAEGPTRLLSVRASGARSVDVMGDFTEWEAREMARAADTFQLSVPLTAGSHRMLIRIDGGPWRAAVNTPVVDDELGGHVGLLVVP